MALKIQVKHGHTSVGPSEVQRLLSGCAPSGAAPYCCKDGADKERPALPARSGRPQSVGSCAAHTWKVTHTARKCFKYRLCFPMFTSGREFSVLLAAGSLAKKPMAFTQKIFYLLQAN